MWNFKTKKEPTKTEDHTSVDFFESITPGDTLYQVLRDNWFSTNDIKEVNIVGKGIGLNNDNVLAPYLVVDINKNRRLLFNDEFDTLLKTKEEAISLYKTHLEKRKQDELNKAIKEITNKYNAYFEQLDKFLMSGDK